MNYKSKFNIIAGLAMIFFFFVVCSTEYEEVVGDVSIQNIETLFSIRYQ